MKLSEALVRQREIKHLTDELNVAINDAVTNGMFIEVDVIEYQTLSKAGNTPKIETTIKVNPQEIE